MDLSPGTRIRPDNLSPGLATNRMFESVLTNKKTGQEIKAENYSVVRLSD